MVERLRRGGHSADEAKAMVGAALLEELLAMVKEERSFNLRRFRNLLAELR